VYTQCNITGISLTIAVARSDFSGGYMANNYFTPAELAKVLKLNVATIYQAIKEQQLQATRFGSRYRISDEQLEAWLLARATSS
jgi:excisionase family DNA binding protein